MEEAAAKSIANVSGTTATSRPSADNKTSNLDFDSSLTEEERRFYVKAYPNIDLVRERKVHCTVCKVHIGTAPIQENVIRMHPVLRVTHCLKCHDFYNSGEFSKGEDGSELYCRWCGQGGEVYCCSSCPYVFCKSCIVKNLSRGVVADIEQNENWSCFSCAPKILWPLRAQHWALINYIEQQKKAINAQNLPEAELKQQLSKDHSSCCRLAKSKCGNMSDSMESLESVASRRSHGSSAGSAKKTLKQISTPTQSPAAKRAKSSNDEVVCTPDLMSMLEPDCEITVSPKPRSLQTPAASTPKVMSIQTGFGGGGVNSSTKSQAVPPPLVLRNTGIKLRPVVPAPVVRRTVVGPRTPTPVGSGTPVYHTINGYRIDLNSAAQQETFRLPNGKLIQVKRQGTQPSPTAQTHNSGSDGGSGGVGAGGGGGGGGGAVAGNWQQLQQHRVVPPPVQGNRPIQITQTPFQTVSIQQQQQQQQHQHHQQQQQQQQQQHQQTAQQHPQMIRYHNAMVGNTTLTSIGQNGTQIQVINGAPPAPVQSQMPPGATLRPLMVRHIFPDTPIGQARSQLQDQVFNAMEICTHLTGKVQTLTNSNAYKQARNYLEVKELYIHLSYLLTYAIGRFKGLQDKCLADMRQLGFVNDADCLENGQLAADKQASDDEDNDIEIVEPKTDTITLDSDNEDEETIKGPSSRKTVSSTTQPQVRIALTSAGKEIVAVSSTNERVNTMPVMHSILGSILEVELNENSGSGNSGGSVSEFVAATAAGGGGSSGGVAGFSISRASPSGSDSTCKKQPRKKTTNKPNPTLLKQKEMLERERLEEMKRSDLKLKMKCAIELKKAEDEYPFAKDMLNIPPSTSTGTAPKTRATEETEVVAKCRDSTPNKSTLVMASTTEAGPVGEVLKISEENCGEAEEVDRNEVPEADMVVHIETEKDNRRTSIEQTETVGNEEEEKAEESDIGRLEEALVGITEDETPESAETILPSEYNDLRPTEESTKEEDITEETPELETEELDVEKEIEKLLQRKISTDYNELESDKSKLEEKLGDEKNPEKELLGNSKSTALLDKHKPPTSTNASFEDINNSCENQNECTT